MIDVCVLRVPYDIIKSKKFPFSYPANAKCVWFIAVDKGMEVKVDFQAFETLLKNKHCIEYVKIKNHRDPHANYNCGTLSSPQLISTGSEVQISFITDPNIK